MVSNPEIAAGQYQMKKVKLNDHSRVPLSRARELVKEYGIDGYPGITKLLGDDPMDGKEDEEDEEDEEEDEEKKKNDQKEDHIKGKLLIDSFKIYYGVLILINRRR